MTQSEVIAHFESTFDELFVLESIIKLTREACLEREFNSSYYDLSDTRQKSLSEERNHYINMLSIALDRVTRLKNINTDIEREIPKLQNYAYNCC